MTGKPFNKAFAPNLTPVFNQSAATLRIPKTSRELFHTLIPISENYPALPYVHTFLSQNLHTIHSQYQTEFTPSYTVGSLHGLPITPPSEQPMALTTTALNKCLCHYAPIYFTELSWLIGINQTASNQAPLAVDLMAMLLGLLGNGVSLAHKRTIYDAQLLAAGITLPALHTQAFSQHADIADAVFDFAAIQLGFVQFPRTFFAEILGFTWSYLNSPALLEHLFTVNNTNNPPYFFTQQTQNHPKALPQLEGIINTYFDEFNKSANKLWQRFQAGYWLHQHQLRICTQVIAADINTVFSPRQLMGQLLAKLIPHAIGHHGTIRLGTKTLDEWFKERPFKTANFLATLLHSPYVDRVKPENSKLLKLFEFNGPMFGVLTDKDKTVIKAWLLAELNPGLIQTNKKKVMQPKLGLTSLATYPEQHSIPLSTAPQNTPLPVNFAKLSNRNLYYYWVNCELYPNVLTLAKRKVNRVLTVAKWTNRLPFKVYTHDKFTNYIKTIYQHEVATYKPLSHKPKISKTAYAWGIEQFAPTILTDGSWLQGIHQLDYQPNHAIGALLQKIYRDEIGNGILAQNHPHIYQALLDSLAINLPPIFSREFSQYPGFVDSAFDIPVFFMAIAQFPSAYLPEILGLNMAIELSGLGRVYLRLSQALSYWGINPAIVDVHITIDNLASGHSALAIKAIQTYLDDMAATGGETMMQAHWQRIYTGFCTLATASRRFKLALISHYLLNRSFANNPTPKGKRDVQPF
jgi:Iron-containing redox enzyme